MAITSVWVSGIGEAKYKSIKTALNASNNSSLRRFVGLGGDEIKNIGLYTYHLFTTAGSHTFTGNVPKTVEVLAVGGGGSGGGGLGGGGGGGGIEPASGYSSISIPAGSINIFVGAGGPSRPSASNQSTSADYMAQNSTFNSTSLIAQKGGMGAPRNVDGEATTNSRKGGTGGSGGGGYYSPTNPSVPGVGGDASGNNAFAGGNGIEQHSAYYSGGGGGGAGGVGSNASTSSAGAGGPGKLMSDIDLNLTSANFTSFSGMTRFSAGGGGGSLSSTAYGSAIPGGAGGVGGGGAGDREGNGGNGSSFGSGGGGTGAGNTGAGHRGIVIVRYLT